jgi:hypothetical protein
MEVFEAFLSALRIQPLGIDCVRKMDIELWMFSTAPTCHSRNRSPSFNDFPRRCGLRCLLGKGSLVWRFRLPALRHRG